MPSRNLRGRVIRTHRYRTRTAALTRTPGANAAAPGHTTITALEEMVSPSRFENMPALAATSVMPSDRNVSTSGGWVEYEAILHGQRAGVRALVTPSMLRTGTAPSYDIPFIRRRSGLIIVRGHLLAKVLGGSGSQPRNLVPLYHSRNNLPMYKQFEHRVKTRVLKGDPVYVEIRPHYPLGGGPMAAFPDYISYTARTQSGANVLPGSFMRIPTGFHS